jgi:hypothetical protein
MPPWLRKFFKILNKYFMVPIFRLGLGAVMTNPFSGYIMVMKVVGRRSNKIRYTPVNYAIHNGAIYCVSGGRDTSDWYKNLKVIPNIELIMPGGAVFGSVDEYVDSTDRLTIIRKVLQNAGFAGFFEGYNPYKISDEELAAKSSDLPIFKITPTGIGNGAADPKGWAWILTIMLTAAFILVLFFA